MATQRQGGPKRAKRVLFISRRFYPEVIGGGQISAWYIAKAVKAQGMEVSVLTFTDGGFRKERLEGIIIYRVPIRGLAGFPRLSNMEYMYWEMGRLIDRYLPRIEPDIVHCLNVESIPAYALFTQAQKRIPFVATLNGVLLTDFIGDGTDSKGKVAFTFTNRELLRMIRKRWGQHKSYLRFISPIILAYARVHMALLKRSGRRAARLLPVSHAIKASLLANGFPEEQLTVIHNPIDVQKKVKTDLKQRLKIDKYKKVLLYVGRLDKLKGIGMVIEAMPFLEDVVFVVVGRGADEEAFKRLSEKLGVQERVRFVGYVDHKLTPEYYSIADVAVLPETFFEPLSRMLLEACSFGIPCIVSDRGGNCEIIEDLQNGIILKQPQTLELIKTMKRLLSGKEAKAERMKMGRKGRLKIKEQFAHVAIGKRIIKVYKAINL